MSYRGRPAVASSGQEKIYTVEDLEWVNSGALSARFTLLIISSGLRIFNCALFTKGCSRWVNPPSQRITGEDGRTSYRPTLGFKSNFAKVDFLHKALAAVDRYLESYSSSEPEKTGGSSVALFDDDDCADAGSEVDHGVL